MMQPGHDAFGWNSYKCIFNGSDFIYLLPQSQLFKPALFNPFSHLKRKLYVLMG